MSLLPWYKLYQNRMSSLIESAVGSTIHGRSPKAADLLGNLNVSSRFPFALGLRLRWWIVIIQTKYGSNLAQTVAWTPSNLLVHKWKLADDFRCPYTTLLTSALHRSLARVCQANLASEIHVSWVEITCFLSAPKPYQSQMYCSHLLLDLKIGEYRSLFQRRHVLRCSLLMPRFGSLLILLGICYLQDIIIRKATEPKSILYSHSQVKK